MSEPKGRQIMQVKKYPNRRFYDTTQSRHVTLQELHEGLLEGKTLEVTDTRTGEDITNVILIQILLEKDPPKLHLFPTWILHALVRSKPSAFRTAMEGFLAPLTHPMVQSRRQLDDVMNRAMSGEMISPIEWAQAMMRSFAPKSPDTVQNGRTGADTDAPEPAPPDSAAEVEDLRRQLAELARRLEAIRPEPPSEPHPQQGQG